MESFELSIGESLVLRVRVYQNGDVVIEDTHTRKYNCTMIDLHEMIGRLDEAVRFMNQEPDFGAVI